MKQIVTLSYGDCPPSLNSVGSRGGGHWAYTSAKKRWQKIMSELLLCSRIDHGVAHVSASAVLRFPVKRGRDVGNFQMIDKALGDALVKGGYIADDVPQFYKFTGLSFDDELGPKRTTVVLVYDSPISLAS